MPQAFADAVCNERVRMLKYHGDVNVVEVSNDHSLHRPRGFEGTNGVACDWCKARALKIWTEYQRILTGMAARTP